MSRIYYNFLLLILIVAVPIAAHAQSYCCPSCVPTCVTERNFRGGHQDTDLRIRIVGRKQSTIEAYFGNHFDRFVLPTGDAIVCPTVSFSKPSTEGYHGTFAVRFYNSGIHGLALCGWKGSSLKKLYPGDTIKDADGNDIAFQIDQSRHFRLEWMTNQICRIQHGQNQKQLTIVRFDSGADDQWRLVYAGPLSGE